MQNPQDFPKNYDAQAVELELYKRWEDAGVFNPDRLPDRNQAGEPYAIMMPPPNVTGVLHLGHALENSLMDTMVRFQRLRGKKAMIVPGTDHAALPTQAKVEKILTQEGMANPRLELGREGLLQKIRTFAEGSQSTILDQVKKMGTSCDWSRLAFTFDDARSEAVNEIFCRMYQDGLIYRGYRVVNWSVKGQSTCSDDEVAHVERMSKIYTFKYSKDFPITIATTRPETKLGDTAVAVHPTDERYQKYIGQSFTVDFGAKEPLQIKIIADENVDKTFGTGALGVTPAHSSIDFEMYEKQKAKGEPIGLIPVIGMDGKMTEAAGPNYVGMTVEEAREKVAQRLREQGLMEKEEEVQQNIGTSDRFVDVIEAIPMTQWWLNMNKVIPSRGKSLRDLMREAVTTGLENDPNARIAVMPERYEKLYLARIENLRDWCLSRQIWWGHRIPVWYKRPTEPVSITFVTHGSTQDNITGVYSGDPNVPLADLGREQCVKQGELLASKEFDVIITSDFQRAVESAEITFKGRDIPFIQDKRLREIDLGTHHGALTFGSHINTAYENGESCFDVERRMREFLQYLAESFPGKKVAIIAHCAPQLALDVLLHGKSWQDAIAQDWRKKEPKAWQPGWQYVLSELSVASAISPGEGWEQDPDTLDTWFSSATWTFSTLGWPHETSDLKTFHPTPWITMGYEIVYLWMMRMILMSTYTLEQIPFKTVYLHGMLRDEQGKKFSKSAGNNIDPLEIIEKYGCDALRWSILIGTTPGNDSRFYEDKVDSAKNLVNKLWNISRYLCTTFSTEEAQNEPESNTFADRWLKARLSEVITSVTKKLEESQFSAAGEELREFTWSELADWYVEIAKVEKGKSVILRETLKTLLILWHPFMPFVTEEIWRVSGFEGLLALAVWPKETKQDSSVAEFERLREAVTTLRRIRAEQGIEAKAKIEMAIRSSSDLAPIFEESRAWMMRLTNSSDIKLVEELPAGWATDGWVAVNNATGAVGEASAAAREKELAELEPYVVSLRQKLANVEFTSKAPEKVVKGMQEKLQQAEERIGALSSK